MSAGLAALALLLVINPAGFPIHPDAGACGTSGGDCFWIGGTGLTTDGTHWSSTTGGAACTCTPIATNTVTWDSNSGSGTSTLNADLSTTSVVISSGSLTVQPGAFTWTVAGNWNSVGGTMTPGSSSVKLTATGTLRVGSHDFWNLIVDTGVTTTYYTPVEMSNRLTVNGALVDHDLVGDPFLEVQVIGRGTDHPLVVGPSGSVAQVGVTRYLNVRTQSVNPMKVAATTYRYLAMYGENTTEIDLDGNIATTNCGIDNQCAILVSGYSPYDTVSFDTKNFTITSNAIFWIGDLDLRRTVAHFWHSHVIAKGFDIIDHSVAYLDNGLFDLTMPPGLVNDCNNTITSYTQEYGSTVHAGHATLNVATCFTMNAYPQSQVLYAENSIWNLNGDGHCWGPNDHIYYNESTWHVTGTWGGFVGGSNGSYCPAPPPPLPPKTFSAMFAALFLVVLAVGLVGVLTIKVSRDSEGVVVLMILLVTAAGFVFVVFFFVLPLLSGG